MIFFSSSHRLFLCWLVVKAVCYLNSHGKDFEGGMFHFQDGDPATIVPMAGVSESYCFTRSWFIVGNIHQNETVTLYEIRAKLVMIYNDDSVGILSGCGDLYC